VRVADGARRFEAALVARGAKAGNVKPAALHAGLFWTEVFPEAAKLERKLASATP
jgi:hypothetical protein